MCVERDEREFFDDGLRDQGAVEWVLMYRFQIADGVYVLRPQWNSRSRKSIESIGPSTPGIANVELTFHALQQNFPVRENANSGYASLDLIA